MARFDEEIVKIKPNTSKRSFLLKSFSENELEDMNNASVIEPVTLNTSGPEEIPVSAVTTPAKVVMPEIEGSGIVQIHINQLKEHKHQSRKYFDQNKIEELAQSLTENGIITPLKVIRVTGGFEIASGERRYRAAKIAGIERLPCILVHEREGIIQSVIENLQRENLNIFEEGRDYDKLLGEKIFETQKEMARKLGVKESRVSEVLSYFSKISHEDQMQLIQEGKTSRDQLRKFIENKKRTYATSRVKHLSVNFLLTGDSVIVRSNAEKIEFDKCLIQIRDEINRLLT